MYREVLHFSIVHGMTRAVNVCKANGIAIGVCMTIDACIIQQPAGAQQVSSVNQRYVDNAIIFFSTFSPFCISNFDHVLCKQFFD